MRKPSWGRAESGSWTEVPGTAQPWAWDCPKPARTSVLALHFCTELLECNRLATECMLCCWEKYVRGWGWGCNPSSTSPPGSAPKQPSQWRESSVRKNPRHQSNMPSTKLDPPSGWPVAAHSDEQKPSGGSSGYGLSHHPPPQNL